MNPISNFSMEKAVIGGVLRKNNESLYLANKNQITEESFASEDARLVWRGIQEMAHSTKGIDTRLLIDHLDKRGRVPDAPHFLDDCIDACVTSDYVEYYCQELRKVEVRREGVDMLRSITQDLTDGQREPDAVLSQLSAEVMRLTACADIEIQQIKDFKDESMAQFDAAEGGGVIGLPSSLPSITRKMGGYMRKVMCILAARPGTGKSTFMLQEALYMAKEHGLKVALYNCEDPSEMAAKNMVGNQADVSIFHARMGECTAGQRDRLGKAFDEIGDLPIYMIGGRRTIGDIVTTTTMLKRLYDIDIVMVDHLQLLFPLVIPGMSRNDTVSSYSGQLATLVQRMDIAGIVNSQLSRKPEDGNRKPRASDLRDSGSIEQDARQILLMHHDKAEDTFNIEIAKNNFGPDGIDIEVERLSGKQRFEEVGGTSTDPF